MIKHSLATNLRWILLLPALIVTKNSLQMLIYLASSRLGFESSIFDYFYGALITITSSLAIYWLSPRYKWICGMGACLIQVIIIMIDYMVLRFIFTAAECDGQTLWSMGMSAPLFNQLMDLYYPINCDRQVAYAGGVFTGAITMFFYKERKDLTGK